MTEKPLILIVDDEADPRVFLYELLDSEGYRVATCENGFEALGFVSRNKPALVIADMRMPSIDGLELLSKVKYMAPGTRVIIYTAYGNWPMFLEVLEKGGADLIPKGASNAEILHVVRRVLEEVPHEQG
ncbi:MAG: response regulator [Planctomycetes bacterium]|nr:response regulator [Planctomycetota bacterium]